MVCGRSLTDRGGARLAAAEAGASGAGARTSTATAGVPTRNRRRRRSARRSDATRLRGSYRYTRYGVVPPPTFPKRESAAYRRHFSSPFAASSSSSSRLPTVSVKMELDDTPMFAPGDFIDDAELERILPKLGEEAGFNPGDFVDDNHLDTVIRLVSQTSCREADKAEEWRMVAKEKGKIYVDLGSDGE